MEELNQVLAIEELSASENLSYIENLLSELLEVNSRQLVEIENLFQFFVISIGLLIGLYVAYSFIRSFVDA